MANSYIGTRSPKGNVGVRGVVDAGELSAMSAGTLSGFAGNSVLSWTINIGGVSGTQDVVVAKNTAGESDLLVGTTGQSIAFIIGGAPGTPGQSRTDALVIYKDPFDTALVNDGIDTVDYLVVAGTAATTSTQVPPSDATIRAACPTGAFVGVAGYVTIAQGQSSVSLGNYTRNLVVFNDLLIPEIAETSELLADTWWHEIGRTTLGVAGDTISVASIPARKYLCAIWRVVATGGTVAPCLRFNNDSGNNYSSTYSLSFGAAATVTSQPVILATGNTTIGSHYGEMTTDNFAATQKVVRIEAGSDAGLGAANGNTGISSRAKWANTSAQINRIDLVNSGGTGDFAAGGELIILGHD